jgi:hypothetical protein
VCDASECRSGPDGVREVRVFQLSGRNEHLLDRNPARVGIVAVADTFEALTSARSYRGPLPEAEARAELLRVAGTQLDPKAVEALVALLDEGWELPRKLGVPVDLSDSSELERRRGTQL